MGSVVAAPQLWSTGLRAVMHRLDCSEVREIFPDQGSNPCSPALAGRFLSTEPPGKPSLACLSLAHPSSPCRPAHPLPGVPEMQQTCWSLSICTYSLPFLLTYQPKYDTPLEAVVPNQQRIQARQVAFLELTCPVSAFLLPPALK